MLCAPTYINLKDFSLITRHGKPANEICMFHTVSYDVLKAQSGLNLSSVAEVLRPYGVSCPCQKRSHASFVLL